MSYGQQLLKEYIQVLVATDFIENHRPEWLHGLELDFYFPETQSAIEFNGGQHICVSSFTTPTEFHKQCYRDRRKKALCKTHNVILVSTEAIDLEYTRLNRIFRRCKLKRNRLHKTSSLYSKLKDLNNDAKLYRQVLIEKYGCPTARRRNKHPRKHAMAAKRKLL